MPALLSKSKLCQTTTLRPFEHRLPTAGQSHGKIVLETPTEDMNCYIRQLKGDES